MLPSQGGVNTLLPGIFFLIEDDQHSLPHIALGRIPFRIYGSTEKLALDFTDERYLGVVMLSSATLSFSESASVLVATISSSGPRSWCFRSKRCCQRASLSCGHLQHLPRLVQLSQYLLIFLILATRLSSMANGTG